MSLSTTSGANVPAIRRNTAENLVGFNFWLGSSVTFRPELRFEHSYDVPAYDSPSVNGVSGAPTKKSQLTLAGDVIYHF